MEAAPAGCKRLSTFLGVASAETFRTFVVDGLRACPQKRREYGARGPKPERSVGPSCSRGGFAPCRLVSHALLLSMPCLGAIVTDRITTTSFEIAR